MGAFRQGTELQTIQICDFDPTVGPGVPGGTPNLLMIRTDTPSLYYYKGPLDTDWVQLGGGGGAVGPATALAFFGAAPPLAAPLAGDVASATLQPGTAMQVNVPTTLQATIPGLFVPLEVNATSPGQSAAEFNPGPGNNGGLYLDYSPDENGIVTYQYHPYMNGNFVWISQSGELGLYPLPGVAVGQVGSINNYNGQVSSSPYLAQPGLAGLTITGLILSNLAGNTYSQTAIRQFANFGPGNLTLAHNDVGSAAGNRFMLPGGANLVIPPNGMASLIYTTAQSAGGASPYAPGAWLLMSKNF